MRRITLPDGGEGEVLREVYVDGQLVEVAWRRLPDGEEQRVYFTPAQPEEQPD